MALIQFDLLPEPRRARGQDHLVRGDVDVVGGGQGDVEEALGGAEVGERARQVRLEVVPAQTEVVRRPHRGSAEREVARRDEEGARGPRRVRIDLMDLFEERNGFFLPTCLFSLPSCLLVTARWRRLQEKGP